MAQKSSPGQIEVPLPKTDIVAEAQERLEAAWIQDASKRNKASRSARGLGLDEIEAFLNPSQPLVEIVKAQVYARDVSDDDGCLLFQRSGTQGELFERIENAVELCVNPVEPLFREINQFVGHADNMPFPASFCKTKPRRDSNIGFKILCLSCCSQTPLPSHCIQ
jgi:hypothetical protein